jgi:shikimate kinase
MMNVSHDPIYLIGYRGTGKTSVARELAARLGYDWVDSDDVVEREAGKTIAEIFAAEGEDGFREREVRAVDALSRPSTSSGSAQRPVVVALGGGAVLREESRQAICGAGPVVWLTATADTILERLAADPVTARRRPGLTSVGGRAEIEKLLVVRTPLYRQCATLVVDTEGKTPAEVADQIVANL